MRMKFVLILGILFCCAISQYSHLLAEEEEGDQISRDFISGTYLIYHCQNKFGACVDRAGFEFCNSLRTRDLSLKRSFVSCAPIKPFSTLKECQGELQKQIHRVWKEKELCRP